MTYDFIPKTKRLAWDRSNGRCEYGRRSRERKTFRHGVKDSGHTVDAGFPLDALRGVIEWLGLIKPETTWMREENGVRCIVTYERVT
jgi:hypothetical protein